MQKANEVLINVPFTDSTHSNNFPYISEAVLRESEIKKEIGKNKSNRISGETPNYVTIKDNILLPPTTSLFDVNILAFLGKQVAIALTKILDQLKLHDESAAHSIASMIEPYQEINQDPNPRMPAIPTKAVVVNITKVEKIKPKASLD